MKISKKSWHYRLHVLVFTCFNLERYGPIAYLQGKRWDHLEGRTKYDDDFNKVPAPMSLCSYFWSTLSLLVLGILLLPFVLAGAAIVAFIFYAIYVPGDWIHTKYRSWRPKKQRDPEAPPSTLQLAGHYVAAQKKKHCPLLDVVD